MRYAQILTALALLASAIAAPASADLRPPSRSYELEGNRLVLPDPVVFKTGTAELAPESAKVMQLITSYLQDKSYISLLRIEGHVASAKADDASQKLSEQRALAVVKALIAKGTECKRLLAVGFGANKPVASSATPEGRAQNSRIEAVNAELRGRAIGGMPVDGGGKVVAFPCK